MFRFSHFLPDIFIKAGVFKHSKQFRSAPPPKTRSCYWLLHCPCVGILLNGPASGLVFPKNILGTWIFSSHRYRLHYSSPKRPGLICRPTKFYHLQNSVFSISFLILFYHPYVTSTRVFCIFAIYFVDQSRYVTTQLYVPHMERV